MQAGLVVGAVRSSSSRTSTKRPRSVVDEHNSPSSHRETKLRASSSSSACKGGLQPADQAEISPCCCCWEGDNFAPAGHESLLLATTTHEQSHAITEAYCSRSSNGGNDRASLCGSLDLNSALSCCMDDDAFSANAADLGPLLCADDDDDARSSGNKPLELFPHLDFALLCEVLDDHLHNPSCSPYYYGGDTICSIQSLIEDGSPFIPSLIEDGNPFICLDADDIWELSLLHFGVL